MLFTELGLAPEILHAIDELGYHEATPIQEQAIPQILSGYDILAAAQTGTGKTAAFMLPILERLKNFATNSTSPAMHPIRTLVLSPTRELADQIASNTETYTKHLPLRHTAVFGGVNPATQEKILANGVEIVIATPGRLLDHIAQKSVNLGKVSTLVLDEADRMLDMGFINDIKKIISLLPVNRQILLFSATFAPEIRKLAGEFMKKPVVIKIDQQNSVSKQVEQLFYAVDSRRKLYLLEHLIKQREMSQVIVFCKTKQKVSQVCRELKRSNLSVDELHGDKSQSSRLETMDAFKTGQLRILVATDVAARGLDIDELPYVINYELPFTPEDYVHRIGRTGRAGSTGIAISLVAEEEEKQLRGISKLIDKPLKAQPLEGFWPSWITQPETVSTKIKVSGVRKKVIIPLHSTYTRYTWKRSQKTLPALLKPIISENFPEAGSAKQIKIGSAHKRSALGNPHSLYASKRTQKPLPALLKPITQENIEKK